MINEKIDKFAEATTREIAELQKLQNIEKRIKKQLDKLKSLKKKQDSIGEYIIASLNTLKQMVKEAGLKSYYYESRNAKIRVRYNVAEWENK